VNSVMMEIFLLFRSAQMRVVMRMMRNWVNLARKRLLNCKLVN